MKGEERKMKHKMSLFIGGLLAVLTLVIALNYVTIAEALTDVVLWKNKEFQMLGTSSLYNAGNTTLVGTLAVTGASTLTGNTAVTGTLGVTGATTTAAIAASGAITSSVNDMGWAVVAGADTACTTTCTFACLFGVNTASATADIVNCADATADECLCAGAS